MQLILPKKRFGRMACAFLAALSYSRHATTQVRPVRPPFAFRYANSTRIPQPMMANSSRLPRPSHAFPMESIFIQVRLRANVAILSSARAIGRGGRGQKEDDIASG